MKDWHWKNVPIIKFIKNWHWKNIKDQLISPFLFLREKWFLFCTQHLNILNILNIWTFEQKLQWYLVKTFLCSARASTIPPKKTYSLSRKKSKSMSVRVHNIFTYQSQNKSKIVSVKMSIFLHNEKDLGFLCKVILSLKCCQVGKKWIFKPGSHRFEKTNILVILKKKNHQTI